MIDFQIHSLRLVLERLESNQDTSQDRELLVKFLRDFLSITEATAFPGDLSEAIATLKVNDMENKHLLHNLEQRVNELESLRQVSMIITSSLDLRQVLRSVLVETLRLVRNIQDAHIFLYENGRLNFGAALFSNGQDGTPYAELRPQGLTYTVARLAKTIAVPDMSTHPLFTDTGWTGSIIGIPLKIGSRVVGVMTVCREQVENFNEDESRVLQLLADHAAIAIENARLHKLVDEQAHHDPLTGLFNRRSLDERLESELLRYNAMRANPSALATPRPFSLLMMDLDGFKEINDTYGHLAGDYVLKEIVFAISQALRKTDFLARYGGDEMAVVISDADAETAQQVASRIQDFVARARFNLPNMRQKAMTLSIGGALYPENASDIGGLVQAADNALLEAKKTRDGKVLLSQYKPETTGSQPEQGAPTG